MSKGEKIKNARKRARMTQKELAEKLGLSFQSVAQWENGLRNPKQETLQKIADALGIPVSDLAGETDGKEKNFPSFGMPIGEILVMPVAVTVRAGFGSMAVPVYGEEVTEIPKSMLRGYPPEECFAARVKGNSMYPRICEGDIVVIHMQNTVESGEIALVVYDDNEEATIKRVRYEPGKNWVELIPANPEYMTLKLEGDALPLFHILGRVISLIRDF